MSTATIASQNHFAPASQKPICLEQLSGLGSLELDLEQLPALGSFEGVLGSLEVDLERQSDPRTALVSLVTLLALIPYRRDVAVSLMLEAAGEQFTIIKVLAVPPIESCRICVSLCSRYGTFRLPAAASMTLPKAVKDLLISMASFF